ncbi:hypothetical protein MHOCP_24580 [Moorella humiferrea]|uniref:Uncharacterized protein n=1 Tax=Neomoorella humiferrea TaxID=676965 RepID=A0A2T0AS27_9FIRM|nr:hypothetical protein MOHU_13020 [Moorella humiferrea]
MSMPYALLKGAAGALQFIPLVAEEKEDKDQEQD